MDYYLLHGDWTEPDDQEELNTLLASVRSWLKNFLVNYDPSYSSATSIDWVLIRDELLPDSNQFIDDSLRARYAVPLRKTTGASGGQATKFDRRIVQLAAVYIAWRIETFQFPGSAHSEHSEYGKWLETVMNQLVNDLVTDKIRLRGQRLKGQYRTTNPRFEPTQSPNIIRGSDALPGVQPFNNPGNGTTV